MGKSEVAERLPLSPEDVGRSYVRDTCSFHPDRPTGEKKAYSPLAKNGPWVSTGFRHAWLCDDCVIEDPYQ